MPQATNLVVKNGAGTPVDKTFDLINPAAGLDSAARWALKEGVISSVFPTFEAVARRNNNAASKLRLKFALPSSFTDSVTGLTNVSSRFEASIEITVPDNFPEALKADAVAFTTNLVNTTLVKAMIRDAIPAT